MSERCPHSFEDDVICRNPRCFAAMDHASEDLPCPTTCSEATEADLTEKPKEHEPVPFSHREEEGCWS